MGTTKRKTLYVDVDNTIYDVYPQVVEAGAEIFGVKKSVEDISHWFIWQEWYGEDWWEAFEIALSPEKVKGRVLYDGVVGELNALYKEAFDIHFMSHNPKPKPLYVPVREWLRNEMPFPFDLTIFGARNDKTCAMDEDPSAFGIVEDKMATVRKARKKGYATYTKITPVNADEPDLHDFYAFESWDGLAAEVMTDLKVWSGDGILMGSE